MRPANAAVPAKDTQAEEARWVRAALDGDRQAFRPIVERYQARVFNLCLRLLGRRHDAEDAAQESFVRAYQALSRFDQERAFSAWIVEIAVNVCRDRLRAAWWKRVLLGDDSFHAEPDTADTPDQAMTKSDELKALVAAMQELKAQDREALAVLAEELPATEAAKVLGITPNALYVRQSRARARLAQILREKHPELFGDDPEER